MTKVVQKNNNSDKKRAWVLYTIILSAAPFVVRYIVADVCDYAYASYDIKDAMYYGITISVSNFSLIGNKKFKNQQTVIGYSIIVIVLFSIFIGLLQYHECVRGNSKKFDDLNKVTWVIIFVSIYVSTTANFSALNTK